MTKVLKCCAAANSSMAWGLASTTPGSKPKWCAWVISVKTCKTASQARLLGELQVLSAHKTSWQETPSKTMRQGKLRLRCCSDLEEVSQLLPPSVLQMVITLQGIKHVLHTKSVSTHPGQIPASNMFCTTDMYICRPGQPEITLSFSFK